MNQLQPGQQLGPYQIVQQIGKGGMATVYKAYQPSMDRYVALKVVSAQLIEDAESLKRFQQEARLIAKLEHPNILPVHDYGEADGIPYMVMRYLEAGTLKDRLTAGPLPLSEIDRVFTQLADALEYAHENGVIHRDIKPSNAMLDKRGDVFLTDFGVAKLLEGSALNTTTGAITGTPAYMSPEQAQGSKADQRSDVYSLGIVLFEMLVGRVPFEAETPLAVILKQIQEPPPPLSVARPDLPVEIEPVLLRALVKDPQDRFASIAEFRDSWKQVYKSLGQMARPPAPHDKVDGTLQSVRPVPPPNAVQDAPAAPKADSISAINAQSPSALSQSGKGPARSPKDQPRKSSPVIWVILGGVVILGAVAVAIILFALARGVRTARIRATQTAVPGSVPESTSVPTQPGQVSAPGGFVAAEYKWKSWVGGNSFYSLATLNGKVYAGGVGGLSIWDTSSGESTKISTRDGLPAAWAPVVYADPLDETIWVGTSSGLAHIKNGEITETFSSEDGLDSDYISAIVRRDDTLIVGTNYCYSEGCGLQEFDGNKWSRILSYPSVETPGEGQVSYQVNHLLVDGSGQLWVATQDGIAMLDDNNNWNVFKTENGLPENNTLQLLMDTNGNLWAGTTGSGLAIFNRDASRFVPMLNLQEKGFYDIHGLAEDAEGNLWIAGYNVARYNLENEKLDVFSGDDGSLPGANAFPVTVDADNTVFIGTESDGLIRYDGEFTAWTEEDMVSYVSYGTILPGTGGLIFATDLEMNGTDVFDPAKGAWQWYGDGPEGAIPMAVDASGDLWYGGYNGVWMVAAGDSTNFTTRHGLPSDDVYQLAAANDGTVYALTSGGLAIIQDNTVQKVFRPGDDGFSQQPIHLIFLSTSQHLYAAADDGRMVGRYNPTGQDWEWFDLAELLQVSPTTITGFAETSQALLIGTEGNGVYRLHDKQWENIRSTDPNVKLPSDDINWIESAPDGAVWFCVDGSGVVRFDGEQWTGITINDGLADNTINDIYFGPDGGIWFATNSGITKLAP